MQEKAGGWDGWKQARTCVCVCAGDTPSLRPEYNVIKLEELYVYAETRATDKFLCLFVCVHCTVNCWLHKLQLLYDWHLIVRIRQATAANIREMTSLAVSREHLQIEWNSPSTCIYSSNTQRIRWTSAFMNVWVRVISDEQQHRCICIACMHTNEDVQLFLSLVWMHAIVSHAFAHTIT